MKSKPWLAVVVLASGCAAPGTWSEVPHGARSVSLSADGTRVTCAPDWALAADVRSLDVATGALGPDVAVPVPELHHIAAVAEDPRGELLAVVTEAGQVALLDRAGKVVHEARLGTAAAERVEAGGSRLQPDVAIEGLAWGPGGELLAISATRHAGCRRPDGVHDSTRCAGAVVLVGRDGAIVRELPAGCDGATTIAFAPDGQSVWSFGDDAVLRRLSVATGEPAQSTPVDWAAQRASFRGLVASPDGAAVFVAAQPAKGNAVAHYAAGGGAPAWRVPLAGRCVALALAKDGALLVALCERLVGSEPATVEAELVLLAPADGKELARLALDGAPRALDTRGDRIVVAAGYDVGVLQAASLVE